MEKLIIIRTPEEIIKLSTYLQDKEFIAIDTETTGTDKDAEIIGISFCSDVEVGYYIILSYWNPITSTLSHLETFKETLELLKSLVNKQIIMHNAVFDASMIFNNFGVELMPSVHTDTMILGHLLDENRSNGLKELGTALFGDDARKEQLLMKESVINNGGVLTVDKYELYKADADLIANYGAKDTILTLKLFYHFVPQLFEQKLDKFFYEDECMPLLRGPTYEMNTTGLKLDMDKLAKLKGTLEAECLDLRAFIHKEIQPHVQDKYPGTKKTNQFNIGAPQQLSWLLFIKLNNEFKMLTDAGKEVCKALDLKPPYSPAAKAEFIRACYDNKGRSYAPGNYSTKTKKTSKDKIIGEPWKYMSSDADSLEMYSKKYKWVEKLLEYAKKTKILNTYVLGIEARARHGIINPRFLQNGTTSGRYSSRDPNFQNLPRDDKRVKEIVIARPGNVFVGADQAQLEPRVFASVSKDPTLMECFAKGEDFYSVVGKPIFDKMHVSAYKKDENSFANKHPDLRNVSKAFALATPYGTSAFQQSQKLHKSKAECQDIIDKYFAAYPYVELMMLESHEEAKANGVVYNLYGRPRRIPEALEINKIYGKDTPHGDLPYQARTLLNLAMNHKVQSTAASIMNRAAIVCWNTCKELSKSDSLWLQVKMVLQVHDQIILEGPEELGSLMASVLQDAMENTVELPGVKLEAVPFISKNLADQK